MSHGTGQIIRELENSLAAQKKLVERYQDKHALVQQQKSILVLVLARIAMDLGYAVTRCEERDEQGSFDLYVRLEIPHAPITLKVRQRDRDLFHHIPIAPNQEPIARWLDEEESWQKMLALRSWMPQ